MKRRLLAIATALALFIVPMLLLPAAAHQADFFAPDCTNSARIAVVVFDGGSLNGAGDDWCAQSVVSGDNFGDPNFSQNNADPVGQKTDIGDHYLMNDFTSSLSIYNSTTRNFRIWMYPDTNYGGIPFCYDAWPGAHYHHLNIGWPYDNTYDSLQAKQSPYDCHGDPF